MIERGNVEHNSQNVYYRSTLGAAEAGSEVRLGLRIRTQEPIRQVLLRIWQEGVGEKLINLTSKDANDAEERFYSAEVAMPEKGCLMWYYFIIVSASGTCFYGNNPEQLGGLGELYHHVPPSFQITVYNKGAKTPDWFKHSVMYQIFPDRFCRAGNTIIEKKGAVFHAHWGDAPCYYKDPDTREIVAYDFFGGNIKGIEMKLDELKAFGISTIYLNPVFESESNHHYDTGDYHKIDPILGTNEEFRHLLDTAREKGIRIIIDGVFSHTGSNSRYFNRQGEYDTEGAFQSKDSPFYEWYNFRNFPYEYDSWWGFNTLPNVTETTPSYMDFIIRNKDSVLHHWMNEGISGWRLDVIDELPAEFSQCFFKELKETDPEAVMIGEVWEDASHKISYGTQREYLCGQEMDSAMNYPFRQNIIDFFLGGINAELCMKRMESLRENYPKENFYAMMNLIGSHDVIRAITLFGEAPYYDGMPAIDQARFRLDEEHYELGKSRLLMAALLQMTYPGVPCIYYGDEIGMQGFKDPYNRRPYEWDGGMPEIKEQYRKFIAERNGHVALRTGELLPLYGQGDVLAYARVIRNGHDVFGREAENDAYIVVFNRSKEESRSVSFDVSDFADGCFVAAFDETDEYPVMHGRVSVKLKPLTAILLRHRKDKQNYDRRAGILLHPTSLPSRYGMGDLGREAYRFVDYLHMAGQSVWQILPLGPVGFGYSPYQSPSAFAGNPMLISLDRLMDDELLEESDTKVMNESHTAFVDFDRAWKFKRECLKKAYRNFAKQAESNLEYLAFCDREKYWLEDYALFMAIKKEYKGKSWTEWPDRIKHRDEAALQDLRSKLADRIGFEKFQQYIFDRQWNELHSYAREKGIKIMGDMPIFVSADSADAWAHQKLFSLNEDGTPKTVAGVPPDYFSATGQLWGNPQYDWDAMKAEDYHWWKQRFTKLYESVDIVRIDHFRGFESYWEVDGKAKTAINGHWVKGPGKPFFDAVRKELGDIPIVAEDLGIITDEVEALRAACMFPGMKVLHFTLRFNEEGRMGFVAPENSIVYTGTHDNNTTVGWYTEDLNDESRAAIADLIGADPRKPEEVCRQLIEFAYASNARLAIVPMQDVLRLDSRSRMNTPGTVGLNWRWRLKPGYQMEAGAGKLKELCNQYKR